METKTTVNTTVTTTVTINTEASSSKPASITRPNEKLLSNDTTFNQLLRTLATNPDVAVNAKVEAEDKAAAVKEAELRAALGEDYDIVFDKKKANKGKPRRPGAIQLRTGVTRVAAIELSDNGICEVFSNGYAVYDNGNRKVVIWVPDCGTATYYFNGLRENEKKYLDQYSEIGLDVLGDCPWYNAIIIAGENRIEFNMEHPKSKGNSSDFDFDDAKPARQWGGGAHFESPETAYLKKEAEEERKKYLTTRQYQVYSMRFELGMTEGSIAEELGIAQQTVSRLIAKMLNNVKKEEFN